MRQYRNEGHTEDIYNDSEIASNVSELIERHNRASLCEVGIDVKEELIRLVTNDNPFVHPKDIIQWVESKLA